MRALVALFNMPHTTGTLLLAICMLLLTSCKFLGLAPVVEDTSKVRDWLAIPVFYGTNRSELADSKIIDYTEEPNRTGLRFGVKNVVSPYPEGLSISRETVQRMGWRPIHLEKPLPSGQKPEIPHDVRVPDRTFSDDEIVAAFNKHQDDSGQAEVVFFVHGCCATFQTSLERAAKIAAYMQLPLVVYDWVSPKGFFKYLENETLAQQTLDEFYDFLNDVEELLPAQDTTLIGHSMGAIFLDSALVRRYEHIHCNPGLPRYKEVVLAHPDADARSYVNHSKLVAANADKTRIYIATDDGRLRASAIAHGGFRRLGSPGDLLPDLCDTDRQDVIDVTATGGGHEMPFWVVANMHRDGKPGRDQQFAYVQENPHLLVLRKK